MSDRLALFVPVPGVPIARIIDERSAIVGGVGSNEAEVTVYYEGNRYGAANVKTYADRARIAAGRLTQSSPTIARRVVPRGELRQVGWFDTASGVTLLEDESAKEALAAWLQVEVIGEDELRFSAPW